MHLASVGKHIHRIRTEKRITQEALAEKLFVTRQAVSAWETGKALPDVETLERIAAVLEVDVMEVIYGVQPSPDLKRVKRRCASIVAFYAVILAVLFIILIKNGTWGTWRAGLRYQLNNPNYSVSQEDLHGSWSMELDLNDLKSNVGKVLYSDSTGCQIMVYAMDEPEAGKYRAHFRSQGSYNRSGGQFVSARIPESLNYDDQMTASAGGLTLPCFYSRHGWSKWKDGDQFTVDITGNHFSHSADWIAAQGGKITLTLSEAIRISTQRLWYWGEY